MKWAKKSLITFTLILVMGASLPVFLPSKALAMAVPSAALPQQPAPSKPASSQPAPSNAAPQSKAVPNQSSFSDAGFKFQKTLPVQKGTFRVTAYSNGLTETGKKPGDKGYGITASGTTATSNRTIAVDKNVIPLGSVVQIEGYSGYFIAEDTGSAINGNDIDMFYANSADTKNYPNPQAKVTIVGTVDLKTLGGTTTGNGAVGGGAAGGVKEAKEGEVVTTEFRQQVQQAKEESSILEKFMIGQAENLFNIGGINSLQNLVYGDPYKVWLDDSKEPMLFMLFSQTEYDKIIKPMCTLFMGAYGIFVVLAIMLSALKLGVGAIRPQARADFWQDINMWVLSAFFVSTFLWFSEILFGFNEGIVKGFENIINQNGGSTKNVSIIAGHSGGILGSLGDIFVFLAEWVLALYMNIVYIARKLVIMLLMVLAPVAAISLLYARTRFFFGVWMKEYIGNIFLQSVHAIVLGIFALIASTTGAGMIFKLGMLIMFVPLSGMLSKWLNMGDSSSMLGKTAAMTGLGSIASLGYMAKSMNDLRKGGTGNVGGSGTGGANGDGSELAKDSATTGLSALMSGSNSVGWGKLKRMSGMIGMGTGAIAGSVLGPMGAAVGGGIGKKIGELAPQLARNGVAGVASIPRGLRRMGEHAENPTGNLIRDAVSGAGNMWNDLSARRDFMGKTGELVGGMVGLGSQGRALGQMMSGVSRDRIMEQEFGNRDLQSYAQDYPGSNVQWRQDNNGSAFYRQDGNGDWQRISPTGASDSTLKNGEERRVDYQFNNGSPWVRQENGSYTLGTTNPSFAPGSRSQGLGINAYGGTGSVARTAGAVGNIASGMAGSVNSPIENIAEQIMGGTAQVASAQQAPGVSVGSQNPLQSGTAQVASTHQTPDVSVGSQNPLQSSTPMVDSQTPGAAMSGPAPASVNPADGGSLAQVAGSNPLAPSPSTAEGASGNPMPSGPASSSSTPAPSVSSGVPLAPAGTVGDIVSRHVQGQSQPVYDTRQVVGLEGSTAQLARTSGAYIVGADGQQFDDRRINAASINPDAYFVNHSQGRGDQRTERDKMADVVHSVGVGTASAWTRSTALLTQNRHRGVV